VVFRVEGRYAEAEPLYKRALTIREKALGPDHPDVGPPLNNLALLYHAQGRSRDAEPLYRRTLALQERALGPDHPALASTLNDLGDLYRVQGRYREAEPNYKRALTIREKALGPHHPDVGTSLGSLALLYHAQGRYAEAEPLYKRALTITEKALGPDHPNVAGHLSNLASLYWGQQKWDLAFTHARRASDIRVKRARPETGMDGRGPEAISRSEPAENRYAFQWLVSAAWPLAGEKPQRRAELTAAAFSAAQWASRTAAEAALGQMAARFAKGQGPLADLVRDLQRLSDEATLLDQRLIAATSPAREAQQAGEQALRDRLAEVESRLNDLHKRLSASSRITTSSPAPSPFPLPRRRPSSTTTRRSSVSIRRERYLCLGHHEVHQPVGAPCRCCHTVPTQVCAALRAR
jgi:tetratricopeptide (TPR) repeat protein